MTGEQLNEKLTELAKKHLELVKEKAGPAILQALQEAYVRGLVDSMKMILEKPEQKTGEPTEENPQ